MTEKPNEDYYGEIQRIQDVLGTVRPRGNYRFHYDPSLGTFVEPLLAELSDGQLLDMAKRLRPHDQDLHSGGYDELYIQWMKFERLRELQISPGMTARSYSELADVIPAVPEVLGGLDIDTVAFLGNGMSSAPNALIPSLEEGHISSVHLFDMVDIRHLRDDVVRIAVELMNREITDVPYPIRKIMTRFSELMDAVDMGYFTVHQHCFEPGIANGWHGKFDRIVNCHGPKEESIEDQLSMLSPRGIMAVIPIPYRIPPGYKTAKMLSPVTGHFSMLITPVGSGHDFRGWNGVIR